MSITAKELAKQLGLFRIILERDYSFSKIIFRSAGYAFPPLGVPADLQSAVKKCPRNG